MSGVLVSLTLLLKFQGNPLPLSVKRSDDWSEIVENHVKIVLVCEVCNLFKALKVIIAKNSFHVFFYKLSNF